MQRGTDMMLFELGEERHVGARLKVFGVGGAGGNAINAMIVRPMTSFKYRPHNSFITVTPGVLLRLVN